MAMELTWRRTALTQPGIIRCNVSLTKSHPVKDNGPWSIVLPETLIVLIFTTFCYNKKRYIFYFSRTSEKDVKPGIHRDQND
ncbi:hypothetical protein GHT06_016502 [Daphnia sinensis]|uniref:Uncharacterized protein n=1 Tax=Daphnia sinensis TaxID=1820382 RepID=A0AAD5PR29_9CRUS|nr:hypothetical protein GHT06_016502 [Daphnia sinensis]